MSKGIAIQSTEGFGHLVPDGGALGQILSKVSGADGDIAWVTPEEDFNETLQKGYGCDEDALLVGHIVYPDITRPNYLITEADNRLGVPAIGIVQRVNSSTSVNMQFAGLFPYSYSGLVAGNLVFIGTDGLLTTTKPDSGYFQVFGFCPEDEKLIININYSIIKLNPF